MVSLDTHIKRSTLSTRVKFCFKSVQGCNLVCDVRCCAIAEAVWAYFAQWAPNTSYFDSIASIFFDFSAIQQLKITHLHFDTISPRQKKNVCAVFISWKANSIYVKRI